MNQAIGAYREIVVSPEFNELERLRAAAQHNEASALNHMRRETERLINAKWEGVVAHKDAMHLLALSEKDVALSEKDVALSEKDAENEMLRQQLAKLQAVMKN
jgi:hypothetical protein